MRNAKKTLSTTAIGNLKTENTQNVEFGNYAEGDLAVSIESPFLLTGQN